MIPRLLLFDVDCTLIDSGGAGLTSLSEAAVEFFGAEGPSLDLAGSTDGGIVRSMFAHYGRPYDAAEEVAFYEVYLNHLRKNLAEDQFGGKVLEGVPELLETLEEMPHHLGLLTGNIAEGAEVKMKHYGLAHHFRFGAYGDDHWDRNKLGPIAMERSGAFLPAEQTVVIGDTPKDVACGKACGAKTVAVATGKFSFKELEACGPDLVLEDLVGEDVVVRILSV